MATRLPDTAPSQADGKAVGAWDDRDPTEWASTLVDVRDEGAAMDGSTDDSSALMSAIEKTLGTDEAAYIPEDGGTLYLGNAISLDSSHNGASIVGDGYYSHVQSDDGGSVNGIFSVWDPDFDLANFTIANLRIEGEGGDESQTGYGSQWGINYRWGGAAGDFADQNMLIDNCWVHDTNSTCIGTATPDTLVVDCTCWNAGYYHGFGIDNESPEDTPRAEVRRALAWNCPGYGIDMSTGSMVLDTAMCFTSGSRTGGGMKFGSQHVNSDAYLLHMEDNHEHGVNTTGDHDTITIDKIVAKNNGRTGVVLNRDAQFNIDEIYTTGNSEHGGMFYDTVSVDVGYMEACNNGLDGLETHNSSTGDVWEIVGEGNANSLTNINSSVTVHTETAGACSVPDIIPDRGGGGGGGGGGGTTVAPPAFGTSSASGIRTTSASGRYTTVATTLPDTGHILDDWADDKLSSRDGYDTTALDATEPDSSSFSNPSRAEWTVNNGSPDALNQQLEVPAGDTTEQRVSTSSSASYGTWEFDFQFVSSGTTGAFHLFVHSSSTTRGQDGDGYSVNIDDSGDYRLVVWTNGSPSIPTGTSGTWPADTAWHTAKLTRASDDTWELFLDGTSIGTTTDAQYDAPQLHVESSLDTAVNVDNLRVY